MLQLFGRILCSSFFCFFFYNRIESVWHWVYHRTIVVMIKCIVYQSIYIIYVCANELLFALFFCFALLFRPEKKKKTGMVPEGFLGCPNKSSCHHLVNVRHDLNPVFSHSLFLFYFIFVCYSTIQLGYIYAGWWSK